MLPVQNKNGVSIERSGWTLEIECMHAFGMALSATKRRQSPRSPARWSLANAEGSTVAVIKLSLPNSASRI